MRIGLSRCNYPEMRCIIDNNNNDVIYKNFENINIQRYINKLKFFIFNKQITDYKFLPIIIPRNKVDIFHFVNDITPMCIKWVSTFETTIPRNDLVLDEHRKQDNEICYVYNSILEESVKFLASNHCRKLIALSKNAYEIQCSFLSAYPKYYDVIVSKMTVLQPPQDILIRPVINKFRPNDKIKFLFIGRDFFRKGGGEVVNAFDSLIKENLLNKNLIELTLIGDLERTNNYVLNDNQLNKKEIEEIVNIIEKSDYICHHTRQSTEEILEHVKCANVGLLPTWGDTYGFSVLEMQAAGCPVISTDVRALLEINNNEIGWIVETRKNKFKEIVIKEKKDFFVCKNSIIMQLKKIITDIVNDPLSIHEKSLASIKKIERDHNTRLYFKKILTFYES